ncbi:DnaJ-domain-containing protein [Jaminaea rosea]|uniref:DnaJ-domain-containing protein n=1 Tax=Jaminaea rosea TaxID=1569628 RepID=A0A316V0S9_9BASI|nr:DnaJ-domain-containing protein [Jaminaea rosea]PWN30151.1 DnaJ-domain-containing protein [Jaminaea rosea]
MASSSSSGGPGGDLSLGDAFSLLHLPRSATYAEIRKSYRSLSLKYHPDKCRDVPPQLAADRFASLHKAYELLSDPATRERLAREADEEEKRRERVGKFEEERKRMVGELEKREREEAQRRGERRRREGEVERLRDEGRRLREEEAARRSREEEQQRKGLAKAAEAAAASSKQNGAVNGATTAQAGQVDIDISEPSIGPLDTTVRLLYPASVGADPSYGTSLRSSLIKCFGPLLHFKQTMPPTADDGDQDKKRKRPSEVVCLATFEDMTAALRLVETGSDFRLDEALRQQAAVRQGEDYSEVWVEWASAKEVQQRRRREAKARKANGEAEANDKSQEEAAPPGSKVGEPERVLYWRRSRPDKLQQALQGTARERAPPVAAQPSASKPTAAASFEQDVLKRAMAASEAKKKAAATATAAS